jgi:hypothetical protein
MRYRLRTLLILLALCPPMLALVFWMIEDRYRDRRFLEKLLEAERVLQGMKLPEDRPICSLLDSAADARMER